MDKNYYEILEVDRNASSEIIEKAYKTLAKKYHPDLQDEIHKKKAEEIFKKINEAYQTLSNSELRKSYDMTLENYTISQNQYDEMYEQNQVLKNELNNLQQHIQDSQNNYMENNDYAEDNYYLQNQQQIDPYTNTQNMQAGYYRNNLEYQQQLRQAKEQAYYDAYLQDLRNRGYKIRYKKSFSDYIKSLIALLTVLFIVFLIFQIPFVKNYFIDLYNTNFAFRYITNIFINLFK